MSASYRLISVNELDATLTAAWNSIQQRHGCFESPYFCPQFTQTVASVRDDVRVVVIENDGRPVGFFPHQRARWGRGAPVGGPLSDYHGVIAEPGSAWTVHELMRAARLAVWGFDHLVDASAKFDPYVTAHATSPQIDLSGGFEQYLQKLGDPPSDFVRKARKLAREVGELSFTPHQVDGGALESLLAWKSEQYRRTGAADAFGVRWTGELLRRLMNLQGAEFAGVCSVLRAGDRVVAVHAGMRSVRVLHWWFPTYDPAFARYSPGIILLLRVAEALAAAGVRSVDLGKGDAQYKRSLMTGAAELREGFVELPSLLAKARSLRRVAEAHAGRGGVAATLYLPLRVIRRVERTRRFH
jgi:CelD/BcsL family acetyltransferase involved in cellulose biosynthesis